MTVSLRYWAAAAAAAGTEHDEFEPGTVAEVLAAAVARHPDLERVVAVATVLSDGVAVDAETDAPDGTTLEILPPFAGG